MTDTIFFSNNEKNRHSKQKRALFTDFAILVYIILVSSPLVYDLFEGNRYNLVSFGLYNHSFSYMSQ